MTALQTGALSAVIPAEVLAYLKADIGESIFEVLFGRMELAAIEDRGVVRLSVPRRIRPWAVRYREQIEAAWRADNPHVARVECESRGVERADHRSADLLAGAAPAQDQISREQPQAFGPDGVISSALDPALTFEAFVTSTANRMVHAAALQAASGNAGFNPVYFQAPVGTGKTHLLIGIAHEACASGKRAFYLSAERLLYHAFRRGSIEELIAAILARRDIIAVDDVHFLAGRATQVELRRLVERAAG